MEASIKKNVLRIPKKAEKYMVASNQVLKVYWTLRGELKILIYGQETRSSKLEPLELICQSPSNMYTK